MRQHYEKPKDRENERYVMSALGWVGEQQPENSAWDWDVELYGKLRQVEFRIRELKYPTYMIGKKKYDSLLELKHPILVVIWRRARKIGAVSLHRLKDGDVEFMNGGRVDGGRVEPRDEWDKEMCAYIDCRKFKLLEHSSSLYDNLT